MEDQLRMIRHSSNFRRKAKAHILTRWLPFVAVLAASLLSGVAANCSPGYYVSSSGPEGTVCSICPAGQACPDPTAQTPTSCATGTWSMRGETACNSCPAGHACGTPSLPPTICALGKVPDATSTACVDCGAGQACPTPALSTQVTCTAPAAFASGTTAQECTSCPAGSSCSSTGATACGSGEFSVFGSGQCSAVAAGEFALESYFAAATCPSGTYSSSSGAASCSLCPAGSSCTSSAAAVCSAGAGSVEGSSSCTTCLDGYSCAQTSTAAGQACADGTYGPTGSTSCTQCPAGKSCSATAVLGDCAVGTWSTAGKSACLPCPPGYRCAPNAAPTTQCTSSQYVVAGASELTCTACPDGAECDGQTAKTCAEGFYRTSAVTTCTLCPEGSYCPTPSQILTCPDKTTSGPGATSCSACPAGATCSGGARSTATVAACSAGSRADAGTGTCTAAPAGSTNYEPDGAVEVCPAGFYTQSTGAQVCKAASVTQQAPSTGTDAASLVTCATATEYGTIGGTACQTCDGTSPCSAEQQNKGITCSPGFRFDASTNSCLESKTQSGFTGFTATLNSVEADCPQGFMRGSASDAGADYQCLQCPDLQVCLIVSGQSTWENNWCYLKDPATDYAALGLASGQERLPEWQQRWCIDCKAEALADQLCTFATTYFTTQAGANITCTARSLSETRGVGGPSPYQAKAHFWADTTVYRYPYCKTDVTYYTQTPVSTTSPGVDYSGGATCTEYQFAGTNYNICQSSYPGFRSPTSLTPSEELVSATYTQLQGTTAASTAMTSKSCPAGSSIVMDGAVDDLQACRPWEVGNCTASASADYCQAGTDFKCPIGYQLAAVPANANALEKFTLEDCVKCEAGQSCATSTKVECTAGYLCSEYTEDPKHFASPPGFFTSSVATSSTAALQAVNINQQLTDGFNQCAHSPLSYCPAAATQKTQCPFTYTSASQTLVYGFLESSVYPLDGAACRPEEASQACGYLDPNAANPTQFTSGGFTLTATTTTTDYLAAAASATSLGCATCPAGAFCPRGATAIPCPPGHAGTAASASRKDSCSACSAGSFCAEGSTAVDAAACQAGFYCPARTLFNEEYTCPAGTRSPHSTSTANGRTVGNNAATSSDCLACEAGSYCRAGVGPADSATPLSTCPANAWCEQGDEQKRNCPAGSFNAGTGATASSACTTCAAGDYCPEGSGAFNCPPGSYQDTTGQAGCKVVAEGFLTASAGASAVASCPAGTHSRAGAAACQPCAPGHQCPGDNVETICAAGTYSPGGLSACTACPAGTWCPDTGLVAPKPCWAGHTCPTPTATPTPAPVGQYSLGGTAASSTAALGDCGSGYTCTSTGAIGPHAHPCDSGTYSGAGPATCQATAEGQYTLRAAASETVCPQGYYCKQSEAYYPRPCPRGTYGATTGLKAASECSPCPGGSSCDLPGLTAAYSQCDAGFYCSATGALGAWTPRPRGDVAAAEAATGGPCTPGHYCPAGSTAPTACPAGTYSSSPGLIAESECLACPAGSYCNNTSSSNNASGSTTPTGKCTAGYYCVAGSASATQAVVPAGRYAPAGSATAIVCPPGTFSSTAGQEACTACPAGSACATTAMTAATPCTAGFYCPGGAVHPRSCLAGSYQPAASASDSAACLSCPAGQVCSTEGLSTAPSTQCDAGYVCFRGASVTVPARSLTASGATTISVCSDAYTEDYGLCPAGHWCAAGASCPTACAAGLYNPAEGSTDATACLTCPPGYHCDTTGLAQPTGACPAGWQCPAGSQSATAGGSCTAGSACAEATPLMHKCPPGSSTKTPAAGATSCSTCDAGTYCEEGVTTPPTCPENYYCPSGTTHAHANPCPAGKSTGGATGATALSDCVAVGAGLWIKGPGWGAGAFTGASYGGTIMPGLLNTAGGAAHIVPPGATHCPRGSTCNNGVATVCPEGKFCSAFAQHTVLTVSLTTADNSTYQAVSGPCLPGHWCPEGATSPVPSGASAQGLGGFCPLGYHCGEGTSPLGSTAAGATLPLACAAGTYGAGTGLKTAGECATCPPGFVCASAGGSEGAATACPAGSFCGAGLAATSAATACPVGHKCPAGSHQAVECQAGEYQNQVGQSSCLTCSAGNYCPMVTGSPATAETTCPKGYRCPSVGQTSPTHCLPGTYQDSTGATVCLPCPAGAYCPTAAMTTAGIQCPAGYYCPEGATNYHERRCVSGTYCPAGSSAALACPAGKYCQGSGLGDVSGDCMAGHYCLGSATVPNPWNDPTGARCPKGSYCVAGQQPVECSAGTYNDKLGAPAASYCLDCPPGLTCSTTGLPTPVSTCPAGKTCNGATMADCAAGHYCPAGEAAELVCGPGTYQDLVGQASCKACPAGSYCEENGTSGVSTPQTCPRGYYCPAATSRGQRYPCPAGRYGETTGLKTAGECTLCPEHQHCDRPALTAPSGACLDGFYCGPGSASVRGTGPCPTDFYCSGGAKTECPAGTQSVGEGAASAAECVPCAPGSVCPDHARGVLPCPEGRFCVGGAASTADTDPAVRLCPAGSYCPSGTAAPLKCPPGSYSASTGAAACTPCPAGQLCADSGMTAPTACPAQMACPTTGTVRAAVCSPGTYAATGAACAPCPAGQYCWPSPGSAGVATDSCDPLHVCQSGSSSKYPYPRDMNAVLPSATTFQTYNGPAYPGYRSNGATNVACEPGTYRPGLYGETCLPCPDGRYCPSAGMSEVDAFACAGGRLCNAGARTATPSSPATDGGQVCPGGYFCPPGALHPMVCPDGYLTSSDGQSQCTACPEGKYCSSPVSSATTVWDGSTTVTDFSAFSKDCPSGATCGGGTAALPVCDPGWMRSSDGVNCEKCPAGSYCRGGKIAGQCAAGYWCKDQGHSEPNPWDAVCPSGRFCPHGTSSVAPFCPAGSMSSTTGARQRSDCTACQPGWLCPSSGNSAEAIPCPAGHYCPLELQAAFGAKPQPCPAGTWSPETELVTAAECEPCPAGSDCSWREEDYDRRARIQKGLASLTERDCPVGHFCTRGAAGPVPCPAGSYRSETGAESELDCARCPLGSYCPVGTGEPLQCPDGSYCQAGAAQPTTTPGGTYSNADTMWQRYACPFNHRCPRGAAAPERCLDRTICPPGSEVGALCPAGMYVKDNSAFQTTDQCLTCPLGTYSTMEDPHCHPCEPGYLCLGGTSRKHPTSFVHHGGLACPPGHYCPAGSSTPLACPEGRFNDRTGATSETDCSLCDAGRYNDQIGQQGCRACGAFATSEEGATSCRCQGAHRVFSKDHGDASCRCQSGYDYVDEAGVSRGAESGSADCTPLVFARCEQEGFTRGPGGACLPVEGCEAECGPAGGERHEVVGVCTCAGDLGVDVVCNQQCRKNQATLALLGAGQLVLDDGNGPPVTSDATDFGDLYGDASCSKPTCNLLAAGQDPDGTFRGGYGPPASLTPGQSGRRLLGLSLEDEASEHFNRSLQAQDGAAPTFKNPAYCLEAGDPFLFTISDPGHFPVYQRDSVLNTNPDFDYGAFLALAGDMQKKLATGNTDPSLFAFVFNDPGTYLFADAKDVDKLLLITVMGAGETCADPERFLQPISGSALSHLGVPPRSDIIIGPDYALLASLGCILILSTGSVMTLIAYCLHKEWSIPKVKKKSYRNKQSAIDIGHTSQGTFGKGGNTFVQHKSRPQEESSEEEDDLDEVNMDIYQDLVEAGNEYLKIYEAVRDKRRSEQKMKRSELVGLLDDLYKEILMIGEHGGGFKPTEEMKEGEEQKEEEEKKEEAIEPAPEGEGNGEVPAPEGEQFEGSAARPASQPISAKSGQKSQRPPGSAGAAEQLSPDQPPEHLTELGGERESLPPSREGPATGKQSQASLGKIQSSQPLPAPQPAGDEEDEDLPGGAPETAEVPAGQATTSEHPLAIGEQPAEGEPIIGQPAGEHTMSGNASSAALLKAPSAAGSLPPAEPVPDTTEKAEEEKHPESAEPAELIDHPPSRESGKKEGSLTGGGAEEADPIPPAEGEMTAEEQKEPEATGQ